MLNPEVRKLVAMWRNLKCVTLQAFRCQNASGTFYSRHYKLLCPDNCLLDYCVPDHCPPEENCPPRQLPPRKIAPGLLLPENYAKGNCPLTISPWKLPQGKLSFR